MVKASVLRKTLLVAAVAVFALSLGAPLAFAQDHGEGASAASSGGLGDGLRVAGLAIGAGLAFFGGAIGTGLSQSGIGAGGTGALAEKPELFTNVLILVALPETIVVFGFVIAFLIMGRV